MTTPWAQRYALRTHSMSSSAIRELLKLTQQPDIISFGGGLPAPELFPIEEMKAACDVVLSEMGARALQYSTTEGYAPLREMLARHMARYGINVDADNIIITSGSQQALDLIGKLLINPGDRILTENPSYLGAIQAFTAYQAQYVTVPIDDDGLQVAKLEAALRTGPKFMYILPNFQNPAGVTLSLTRRYDLIALAEEYGIPIVEDDPYGQLRFEGEHLKPLVTLDAEYEGCEGSGSYTGNVIYTSTFSKTLAPGLRLGWIVAPKDVVFKTGADETGHRSAHQLIRSDGGLRSGARRLPGQARAPHPRGLSPAPRCYAACDGRHLPAGSALDAPAGRSVPVGHHTGIDQHG